MTQIKYCIFDNDIPVFQENNEIEIRSASNIILAPGETKIISIGIGFTAVQSSDDNILYVRAPDDMIYKSKLRIASNLVFTGRCKKSQLTGEIVSELGVVIDNISSNTVVVEANNETRLRVIKPDDRNFIFDIHGDNISGTKISGSHGYYNIRKGDALGHIIVLKKDNICNFMKNDIDRYTDI